MKATRVISVNLDFGRHHGAWHLPETAPALLVGPNGCGKTTFVEGILRTVFGFNRKRPAESALCEARRPWRGGDRFGGTLRVRDAEGELLEWSRDHDTDEVRVRDVDAGVVYEGTANPGSRGSTDEPYWALVERVFGVRTLDAFARTAFVGQGALLATEFGSGLLRLSESGHSRLQRALETVDRRHRRITRDPVVPGGRRLPADRPLEKDRQRLEELEERLAEIARAADERRDAETRLADVDGEREALERDLARLEALRSNIAEHDRLDAETEAAHQHLDQLVGLKADLEGANREVSESTAALAAHLDLDAYPEDFPARVERLRAAREAKADLVEASRRRVLEAERSAPGLVDSATPFVGGLVTLASLGYVVFVRPPGAALGVIALLLLMGLAAAIGGSARLAARRARHRAILADLARDRTRLAALDRRIAELLEDIPNATGLSDADALERRLREFESARAARRRSVEARARQRDAMRRVSESAAALGNPGRGLDLLISDARNRMAEIGLRRRRLEEAIPHGWDEAPRTVRAAEEEMRALRARTDGLRSEREELRIRLDRTARLVPERSRLEAEADELRHRIEESTSRARALRRAHALLRDGYAAYRDRDEARLVEAISRHLGALGRAALTPFQAEAGLVGPTVELHGRRVEIDSRMLSHGERHLVKLAIRLGTVDFLAAEGPTPPLFVDEPFAHLDDHHAAQVWGLLCDVARRRQVILTTQEAALVERLGAEPTVSVGTAVSNGDPPDRPGKERRAAPAVAAETSADDAAF